MPGGVPPALPFCHLCGRQFGTTSLGIHMKACKEKWEREHPGKTAPEPARQLPIGAAAGSKDWKQFNEAANEKFNDETLEPCPHCGRTFLPDRLQVHLRVCGKGHFENGIKPRAGGGGGETERAGDHLGAGARERMNAPPKSPKPNYSAPSEEQAKPKSSSRGSSSPGKGMPPALPFCHLCGRQFGTTSLGIHMKACKEKWEREHPGKTAPEPARELPVGAAAGSKGWREFNEAANERFNDETLEPCPHCGRTFLPDRLQVHLRVCGKGHFENGIKPRQTPERLESGETNYGEGAFPSPERSVSSCKLGALARQRSSSAGVSRSEETAEYLESNRQRRAVRDTSSEAIRQRQARDGFEQSHSQRWEEKAQRASTARERWQGAARAASPARGRAGGGGSPMIASHEEPLPPRPHSARGPSPSRGGAMHPRERLQGAVRAVSPGAGRPLSARGPSPSRNRPSSPRRVSFPDLPDLSAEEQTAHVRVDLSAAANRKGNLNDSGQDIKRDNSSRARLAECAELLNDGLITREEFEAKRRAIIDSI